MNKFKRSALLLGLTSAFALSGCSKSNNQVYDQSTSIEKESVTTTAIIMENGNAIIVNLKSYKKWVDPFYDSNSSYNRFWNMYTETGDNLIVSFDSVKFVVGTDSHEKAETIAQSLVGENGQVICYDEVKSYGLKLK